MSKQILGFYVLPVLFSIAVPMTSCKSSVDQGSAQIRPEAPLTVRVGDDVTWRFLATKGSRKLRIVEISPSSTPFGVKLEIEGELPVLRGKVLGPEFQSGLIEVTAYDEEACKEALKNAKGYAVKAATEVGKTDAVIPFLDCSKPSIGQLALNSGIAIKGQFRWTLVGEALDANPEDYVKLALNPPPIASRSSRALNAASAGKLASKGQVNKEPSVDLMRIERNVIAPFELAPGTCANLPRTRCGTRSQCVWNEGVCFESSKSYR